MRNEVLDTIKDEPKKFMKRVITLYNVWGALAITRLYQKWQEEEEIWIIKDLEAKFPKDYHSISWVGSIVQVIQLRYSQKDMGDDNVLETALKLHKLYGASIIKLMDRKLKKKVASGAYKFSPNYSEAEAFKELVNRGFLPLRMCPKSTREEVACKSPYVYSKNLQLYFPHSPLKTNEEAMILAKKVGVAGYTAINQSIT